MPRCIDPKLAELMSDLDEEIGSFSRTTGRDYLLVIVPIQLDEDVTVSLSGHPHDVPAEDAVWAAMDRRRTLRS